MLKPAFLMLLAAVSLTFGQKSQPDNAAKPDTWQKMKDCAAQAEKVGPSEAATNSGSYENHYSPKYNRCFVRVSWIVKQGEQTLGQGNRLVDAFERSTLALAFVPALKVHVCFVGDGRASSEAADCSAAMDFISDHMRN